jgi:hypothetical protein
MRRLNLLCRKSPKLFQMTSLHNRVGWRNWLHGWQGFLNRAGMQSPLSGREG